MLRFAVLTLLLLAVPVQAQTVRPPDLKLQFHRAERAYRTGASNMEAKARLDMVLDALPDDTEARILRARVLLDLDRPEDALVDARAAVELAPNNGEAHLIRCEAARMSGQLDEAMEAMERAAALLLDVPEHHVRLSFNAQMLGDLDRAEAFARLALNLDNSEPGSYTQLARVFVLKNRLDAATTLLASGLEAGVLSPQELLNDATLSPLRDRPELARWF